MPIVRESISYDFQNHFNSENNNENIVSVKKNFGKFWSFLIVIDAQENGVDNNTSHNEVFKSLGLNDFKALKSQTVNWFYWNNLWIRVYQKSLDFDPFFLFFSKVMSTLSLFNFFVKLVYNNGNEQVHNEESSQENEDNVNQGDRRIVLNDLYLIISNLIDSLVHHSWPHL